MIIVRISDSLHKSLCDLADRDHRKFSALITAYRLFKTL